MTTYKISGGTPLSGEITPVPNKNSILKLLPATLLTNKSVTLHNVPMSSDVRGMIRIIKHLGGSVEFINDGSSLKINTKNVDKYEIPEKLSQKYRASIMFMGPLLIRFGKAFMPIAGGCELGTRPLDAFIENMLPLGAKYEREDGYYLEADSLEGTEIMSWFPSVTGTENLIMMATRIKGTTVIRNAATEPHTQDLANFLVSMGAKIEGIGSNVLTIHGVEELSGTEWSVIPDHLDIGAYIAAAALTNGEIRIKNAIPHHMNLMLQVFEKLGIHVHIENDDIIVLREQKLEIKQTTRGDIFEIFAMPWPGLPIDFNQIILVAALKSKGSIIMHNPFQETGMFWTEELKKMKAKVILADPHRAITFGPTNFRAANLVAPNIIQATMALFLAALSAPGVTKLEDPHDALMRRYPDLVQKYTSLGANIEVTRSE